MYYININKRIYKTNNILVIRAAGYIRSHIVEDLIKKKKCVHFNTLFQQFFFYELTT
jgi:hypothetical protein